MSEVEMQQEEAQESKRPPRQRREEVSDSAEKISKEDEGTVYQWLQGLGGGADILIKLERLWPKEQDGVPMSGFLTEFDEPFVEADIKQRFGGGRYKATASKRTPKGNMIYAGARRFEIAGEPRNPDGSGGRKDREDAPAPAPREDPSLARQAMSEMSKMAHEEKQRAWRLEDDAREAQRRPNQIDPVIAKLLENALGGNPIVQALERQVDELKRELSDRRRDPSGPSSTERILEKMVEGEQGRIEALRARHESELRELRTRHEADIRQAREHAVDEVKSRERAHDREISSIRETHEMAKKTLEQSYEARIEALKAQKDDLGRQLTEAKAECAELRARKEKGPIDAIQEIAHLQSALEAVGIGGAGKAEDEPVWKQIAGAVSEFPIVKAIASRVENAPTAPPQPTPQQLQQMAAQRAAVAKQRAAAKKASKPAELQIDPGDAKLAIEFMEAAARNGTAPAEFAESARAMVPKAVLDAIRIMGVDEFLAKSGVDGGSALSTQAGRNFARKVARILVEGASAAEEKPAVQPAQG